MMRQRYTVDLFQVERIKRERRRRRTQVLDRLVDMAMRAVGILAMLYLLLQIGRAWGRYEIRNEINTKETKTRLTARDAKIAKKTLLTTKGTKTRRENDE